MFSALFGKKKDKEKAAAPAPKAAPPAPAAAPRSDAAQRSLPPLGAASMPLTSPTAPHTNVPTGTPNSAGNRALQPQPAASQRDLQRATAEKIDRIESEMSLNFNGRPPAPVAAGARPPAPAAASAQPQAPAARKRVVKRENPAGATSTMPSLGASTDILLGDSILANAMELSDSVSNPAVEEAAILYANGQPLPAISVLSDAIHNDNSGQANTQAWMMLFELYQALGKRHEFENLAIDYAIRFESSSPAWSEANTEKPVAPPPPGAVRPVVTFKGALDGGIVKELDQLKRLALKNPVLWLDFNQVTRVEPAGADLVLRVLAAFLKSSHEVVIQGGEPLVERLQVGIEVGRRDPSNAIWMLLLEMYRLLGRQSAFEETSIDYCVTYEVSPPSWEPPSNKFKLDHSPTMPPVEDMDDDLPADTVALNGELVGKAEVELNRLTAFAMDHRKMVIDCSKLRRVDFTAAGALLNWAVGIQVAGKTIEFIEVSHLTAALFVVMGLHEVAQVERRRV